MFDVQIVGIKYISNDQYGDFSWMWRQNKYSNSLFIFNDNEDHHYTSYAGGGNAIMRMFNTYSTMDKPLSAGIPTGTLSSGGYDKFTPKVKKIIDDAFDEIIKLIKTYHYRTIYFSAELNGKMGTSIFAVNQKVIEYITSKIYKLSNYPVQIVKIMQNDAFDDEFTFDNEYTFDDELELELELE